MNKLMRYLLLAIAAAVSLQATAATVTAGRTHNFIIRDDGTVSTWGWNLYGQLGDGTYIDRAFPVPVPGLNDVKAVAGGFVHSLALKNDGTVWGWGSNQEGELGDGTTGLRGSPGKVPNLVNVTAIAAGYFHSLALKSDGTVWTWGLNANGQLGDGTTTDRLLAVRVSGLTNVVAIAGGTWHSVAVKSDGTVWAWGDNTYCQLGNGAQGGTQLVPAQVKGLSNIARISTSAFHTLALQSDNSVWAWGLNNAGQIGVPVGSIPLISLASKVSGVNSVVSIATSQLSSYAKRSDNTVHAWGGNGYGQLADGTTNARTSPIVMPNGSNTDQITAGESHVVLMKTDGTVWSSGRNMSGQLGIGSLVQAVAPTLTAAPNTLAKVFPGFRHTLAIRNDGTVAAWGDNNSGQLGDGSFDSKTMTTVTGLTSITALAVGMNHSIALKSDGTVWAWGQNSSGELGRSTSATPLSLVPLQVPGLSGVVGIASGFNHVLAVKSDGSVWGWGFNGDGQIGDGTSTSREAPTRISIASCTGCKVSTGGYSSYALRTDGTVLAWGANNYAQLANGSLLVSQFVPAPIAGLTDVATLSTGAAHALVIKKDGSVSGWGWNELGQVGINSTDPIVITPTRIVALNNVSSIHAGGVHSMALMPDGTVLAWGVGGAVGDGLDRDTIIPTPLAFIGAIDRISIGFDYTIAITRTGTMLGWGSNYGQKLGIGYATQTTSLLKMRDPATRIAGNGLVVEYFNPTIRNGSGTAGIGHHFITAATLEMLSLDAGGSGGGWQRTGRVFRAWVPALGSNGAKPASAPANAVPVYRFYASQPNSHFYTASQAEYQNLRNLNPSNNPALGWAYESIEFYTTLPVGDACAAGYQSVYRAYNNRFSGDPRLNDGNHRITPSYDDLSRAVYHLGYSDEGVAFCSATTSDTIADMQAWYEFPGAEVQSGAPVVATFDFSNNGPGEGAGSRVYLSLPPEITDWSFCFNTYDPNCRGEVPDLVAWKQGVAIGSWPAGFVLTILAKGTAPRVTTGARATLNFSALIAAPDGVADATRANNAPATARTLVKGPACTYAINPTSLSFGPDTQSAQVTVSTSNGCAWPVQNSIPWVGISTTNGSGTGTLTVSAQANSSPSSRSGTISIAGQTLTIAQAGIPCTYSANPAMLTLTPAAQQRQITLTAPAGCPWAAQNTAPSWLAVVPGGGIGSQTLVLTVSANSSTSQRVANVSIGSLTIGIAQSGQAEVATPPVAPPDPCANFRLQRDGDQMPPDAASGDRSVAVLTGNGCAWTAKSAANWLVVTDGARGTGNGTLKYATLPNPDPQIRIGTISVNAKNFTVTQLARDPVVDNGGESGGDNSGGGGGGGGGSGGGGSSGGSSG